MSEEQEPNMDIDGRIYDGKPSRDDNDNSLSLAMFSESFPVNPIPFATGLATFVKKNGTDSIKTDDAKQILWILMAQAYGMMGTVDLSHEWGRLWDSVGEGETTP